MFFRRNGKPFFPFGGQCMNSSAINEADRMVFWRSLELLGANTAEIPVFWQTVEPVEGEFDFSIVDTLLAESRERKQSLILLWFGTWKNGMMKYTPDWVKADRKRFRRMRRHDGAEVADLSPHCEATLEADKRAFVKLMEHLRAVDGDTGTVVSVQVQNEAGTLGRCCRDYEESACGEFAAPVPAMVTERLAGSAGTPIHKAWTEAGGKPSGSWSEVFGRMGDEYFAAYKLARFINEIARAGKEAYPLPMFVNVWMDERGWDLPGLDYPAGNPVRKCIDIWKWSAPAIDLICPDIYIGGPIQYDRVCDLYNRPDNPLFIPESDCRRGLENWRNMFSAIGTYHAVGYCAFGTEHIVLRDGDPHPDYMDFIGSFRAVSAVLPLLERRSGKGVYTIRQENLAPSDYLEVGGYRARIDYTLGRTDFSHRLPDVRQYAGCGLIIEGDRAGEFYLTGGGYVAYLVPKWTDVPFANDRTPSTLNYVAVEEGRFDRDGNWVVERIRTGDESDEGIWVYPDVGCVRVVLGE